MNERKILLEIAIEKNDRSSIHICDSTRQETFELFVQMEIAKKHILDRIDKKDFLCEVEDKGVK